MAGTSSAATAFGSPAYRRLSYACSALWSRPAPSALMFVGTGLRQGVLLLHRTSFVVWFAVMVFDVLGHLLDTARRNGGGATTPVGCSGRHRRWRAAGLPPYGPGRILVHLGTRTPRQGQLTCLRDASV